MQIISANCLTQWCNLNEWSDGTQVGLNLNNFINSGLLSVFVEVLRSNQHEECCKVAKERERGEGEKGERHIFTAFSQKVHSFGLWRQVGGLNSRLKVILMC